MNDIVRGGAGTPAGPDLAGALVAESSALDRAEESLAITEGLFHSYVRDLERHRSLLEQRVTGEVDPAALKEAVGTAKSVREAITMMMTERNRVDKLRKDIAGGVGGGALDLDAARDEIGKRLACLRRTR